MREHDDLHDGEQGLIARWIPAAVVAVALAGFVSLAWYAYHAGKQSIKDDDLLVVEADKTPMKEKPADPGGMQFPNQDKTVFETFSAGGQQPAKVERVLPSPEEPLPKHLDNSDTKTYVHDAAADAAKKETVTLADNGPPIPEPVGAVISPQQAAADTVEDTHVAAPIPTPAPVPTPKPVVAAKPAPAVVAKPAPVVKPVEKPAAKPVAKAADTGGTKVQLGAYKSEKEAQDAWTKIQKKFENAANKTPLIIEADLGEKGIYYRLRVGGFYSVKDAKNFCAPLTAGKQACIIATE